MNRGEGCFFLSTYVDFFKSVYFLAICQLRLDFDVVQTVAPLTTTATAVVGTNACDGTNCVGSCASDKLAVTSPSGLNPPTYCGDISGTHSKFLFSKKNTKFLTTKSLKSFLTKAAST